MKFQKDKLFAVTQHQLSSFFETLAGLFIFSIRFFKEVFLPPYEVVEIRKMAELYLYDKEIEDLDCRFDVIAVLLEDINNPSIKHYINAFM